MSNIGQRQVFVSLVDIIILYQGAAVIQWHPCGFPALEEIYHSLKHSNAYVVFSIPECFSWGTIVMVVIQVGLQVLQFLFWSTWVANICQLVDWLPQ